MFTGIIQNRAKVIRKLPKNGQIRFRFQLLRPVRKIALGESFAVNGVCLTVAVCGNCWFEVDVIKETLESTNLGELAVGSLVNIERSLRWGDPMGGHFVTGHVDGKGAILSIEKQGRNRTLHFKVPRNLQPFIISKGSVAIDGVSLTVQRVRAGRFTVGFVPHTLRETTMGRKGIGDTVNFEVDLIARYMQTARRKRGPDPDFLKDLITRFSMGAARPTAKPLTKVWLKKQGF